MSTFKVPLLQITSILPHPNADKLDLAIVAESPVVVGKGQYRAGDTVIYVPVGAVLPERIKEDLAKNSKISLGNKIKAVRIRGVISQGLILDPKTYNISTIGALTVGDAPDVSIALGITKYEEAPAFLPQLGKTARKRPGNPKFRYYTDIEHIKHYPNAIPPNTPVWITEKLHGTSFRCGWFPKTTFSLWERVKMHPLVQKCLSYTPFPLPTVEKYEFCYGSRKVDITASRGYVGFYGEDIYGNIARKYRLAEVIPKGMAVYGEIVGPGVQKGYSYGLTEHELFIYDVYNSDYETWLSPMAAHIFCKLNRLPSVPLLCRNYPYNRQKIDEDFCQNKFSTLDPSTIREGVVVKPMEETYDPRVGRIIFKFINNEYLMTDPTEVQ